ncbi:probable RNA-binding protein CG14230 [Pararge aegeria]|uniref:probable RNA-binding protein CG14230 n=1 Tax=Pararge aegeria TaxID=116150 RepID=UPI0019D2920B|nr:probable RNA-binding protein CG14230 [Pararge aegeria]
MSVNTRLFIGNLPDNFKEHALREAFSSYGNIINFDLKCKPGIETENKKRFAFITLCASNFNVESCIKHFTNEDFHGNKLYVTRARESFLERLQRERDQSKNVNAEKNQAVHLPIKTNNFGDHHNTHKRRFNNDKEGNDDHIAKKSKGEVDEDVQLAVSIKPHTIINDKPLNNSYPAKETVKSVAIYKIDDNSFQNDEKKLNADNKRKESMKKKRQEFNEKKNIIKSGLVSIDKQSNKKIIFSDNEVDVTVHQNGPVNGPTKQINYKSALFDDGGGSDNEINFEVKKQYEGKKGQKVLDLQSRYKSDKRFTLDERFVEDSESEKDEGEVEQEKVDLNQADEKSKQMNILQDVLGVTIKSKATDTNKIKTKLGMLRFDPTQPDHAKYLAPVTAEEHTKKSKKKKSKENKDAEIKEPERVVEKVEVSKEQFYKISDTLKDHNTKTQSTTFSLRSLFSKEDDNHQDGETEEDYIPLQTKKDTKVKNPLDPGEKNPFVYDSSESESEEDEKDTKPAPETNEIKTVWKEKLFLSLNDHRLKDGLIFFGIHNEEAQKERRELKSLMKKRIYNKERKNTMFQKKIGGRKKNMKNKFRKN